MVHFFLGLLILAGFLIYYRHYPDCGELALVSRSSSLVQLVFTLGLALLLSALTVHFRDIRDLLSNLLTFWFFATPIIYSVQTGRPELPHGCFNAQPVHAPRGLVSGDPVLPDDAVRPLEVAARAGRRVGRAVPRRLLGVRSPARFVRGGSVTTADARRDRARRTSRRSTAATAAQQFATLKSALLSAQPPRATCGPSETFTALKDVSFTVPAGRRSASIGRNGSGKSTALKLVAGITKPTSGTVHGATAASRRSSSSAPGSTRRSPAARTSSSTASCSA